MGARVWHDPGLNHVQRHANQWRQIFGWSALALALAMVSDCGSPAPLTPLIVSDARLSGREVSWTSTLPGTGSVRWGTTARRFDRVSYPAAGALTSEHRVPLLSVGAGDSVYLQVAVRTAAGGVVTGRLQAFRVSQAPATPALLRWTMIDVGWGDAHLLAMPLTGKLVLIDGGERRDAPNVERALEDAGVTRLDAVIASHIHEDHVGGLVGSAADPADGVVGTFDVGMVIEGVNPSASRSADQELRAMCLARGIPRRTLATGDGDGTNDALAWDPAVHVAVLHAGGGRALGGATESEWINNDSIVLRVTYGSLSLLFGGDAESPVENALISAGAPLAAAVLKVHHHGSADAGDPAYFDAVDPRAALVPMSVYESEGGTLPSTIVLQRLRERGADVFGSDRAEPLGIVPAGDAGQHVTVTTDGRSFEVGVTVSASRHWPPDAPMATGGLQ